MLELASPMSSPSAIAESGVYDYPVLFREEMKNFTDKNLDVLCAECDDLCLYLSLYWCTAPLVVRKLFFTMK